MDPRRAENQTTMPQIVFRDLQDRRYKLFFFWIIVSEANVPYIESAFEHSSTEAVKTRCLQRICCSGGLHPQAAAISVHHAGPATLPRSRLCWTQGNPRAAPKSAAFSSKDTLARNISTSGARPLERSNL
jgi:hypothetical protein